jgi:hypothetical protein
MGLGSKVLRNKQKAERSTAQGQVQTALGQGKGIDVKGATSGADQGRGFGAVSGGRQGIVVNKPLKPGETQQINVGGRTLFPAKSGNRTVYLPSKEAKPATPLFKSSNKQVPPAEDDKGDNGGGGDDGGNKPPKRDVIVKAAKGGVPGSLNKTTGKWTSSDGGKVAPATPKPTLGPTGKPLVGGIERRTPTRAEMGTAKAYRTPAATTGTLGAATAVASKPAAFGSTSTAPEVKATNTAAAKTTPTPVTPKPNLQQTIRANRGLAPIRSSYEYDAYDLVLEYLLSEGHADTLEEAHYVMMEMDAEMVQDIVEQQTGAIRADVTRPGQRTVSMTATGKEPVGDKLVRQAGQAISGFLGGRGKVQSTTVQPRKPLVSTPKPGTSK